MLSSDNTDRMIELADKESFHIISTGGRIKTGGLALEGSKTVEDLQSYNVEKTILSCKAFDVSKGFTDSSEETVCVKRAMLKAGKVRIMAVDSSKFKKMALCKIVDLRDIDYIVTDQRPDEVILQAAEQKNIKILYPEE